MFRTSWGDGIPWAAFAFTLFFDPGAWLVLVILFSGGAAGLFMSANRYETGRCHACDRRTSVVWWEAEFRETIKQYEARDPPSAQTEHPRIANPA